MVYYFGWIVLSIDLDNDNFTEQENKEMLHKVDILLEPIRKYLTLCERKQENYLETLFVSAAHNHDINYKEDIVSFYKSIGELAKGSYGLLYVRNPEDNEIGNEFIVFRLAKGIVTQHKDNLLSPCNPTIEIDY